MKVIKYIICIIPLFICACQPSTKSEGKAVKDSVVETTMYLCKTDTTAVTGLVNKFMNYYKDAKYADAAGMLYIHPKKHEAPGLLENNQLQEVISSLKSLPIYDFKISSLKFYKAENNEVKCTLYLKNSETINMSFSPTRYLGQWKLCLQN